MLETRVRFLGWEDPLEKEMVTHSSILAWRIPWTEKHGVAKSRTQLLFLSFLSFFLSWLNGKESTCQCRRYGFDPWVRKIPWRRKWQPAPVFLPGESHGRKSLVGYSPWGRKESDTTLKACGLSVPQPGTEPRPVQWNLNHWTTW